MRAAAIYGPDVLRLTGKSTRTKPKPVMAEIPIIPQDILKIHRHLTVCIDVIYVHTSILFLLTVSIGKRYLTVHWLEDCETVSY